ncbi:hypothetical protein CYMTET_14971 [Cymbomonas tetramitiformis]|uniref:Uncharacterized protein n=1 Tax=Cymbomonas tetramitiformis TaxID=36881 RepID=A0AAE0L9M8_9CHLO|nr:hypothetical protein CYMTET_14971 [Cymbomonas tetramitiformis]
MAASLATFYPVDTNGVLLGGGHVLRLTPGTFEDMRQRASSVLNLEVLEVRNALQQRVTSTNELLHGEVYACVVVPAGDRLGDSPFEYERRIPRKTVEGAQGGNVDVSTFGFPMAGSEPAHRSRSMSGGSATRSEASLAPSSVSATSSQPPSLQLQLQAYPVQGEDGRTLHMFQITLSPGTGLEDLKHEAEHLLQRAGPLLFIKNPQGDALQELESVDELSNLQQVWYFFEDEHCDLHGEAHLEEGEDVEDDESRTEGSETEGSEAEGSEADEMDEDEDEKSEEEEDVDEDAESEEKQEMGSAGSKAWASAAPFRNFVSTVKAHLPAEDPRLQAMRNSGTIPVQSIREKLPSWSLYDTLDTIPELGRPLSFKEIGDGVAIDLQWELIPIEERLDNEEEEIDPPLFPFLSSIRGDIEFLVWMLVMPICFGVALCYMPFSGHLGNRWEDNQNLIVYGSLMLGFAVAQFANHWLEFYFDSITARKHGLVSDMSYKDPIGALRKLAGVLYWTIGGFTGLVVSVITTLTAPMWYLFWVQLAGWPLTHGPVFVMVMSLCTATSIKTVMDFRDQADAEFVASIGNSLSIIFVLIFMFMINRLMVLSLGGREDPIAVISLCFLYPILVARGAMDVIAVAEGYNPQSAVIVEAFFTFVSSMFQFILFLEIDASIVNSYVIFAALNVTDISCLVACGPITTFFTRRTHELVAKDSTSFFHTGHWAKDPMQLNPLLIKVYCEISAKTIFAVMSTLIWIYNPDAYPAVGGASAFALHETICFTLIELALWLSIHFTVEMYLRSWSAHFFIWDKKVGLKPFAPMLGYNNMMIIALIFLEAAPGSYS